MKPSLQSVEALREAFAAQHALTSLKIQLHAIEVWKEADRALVVAIEAVLCLRRLDVNVSWPRDRELFDPGIFPSIDLQKLSGLTSLVVRSSRYVLDRSLTITYHAQYAVVSNLSTLSGLAELTLSGMFRDIAVKQLVESFSYLSSLKSLTLGKFKFQDSQHSFVAQDLQSLPSLTEFVIVTVYGAEEEFPLLWYMSPRGESSCMAIGHLTKLNSLHFRVGGIGGYAARFLTESLSQCFRLRKLDLAVMCPTPYPLYDSDRRRPRRSRRQTRVR